MDQPLGPATLAPPCPGRRQARSGAFANDVALKFDQRGKQVKHESALGRGGLKAMKVAAYFSEGSDVTSVSLTVQFPHGLFAATSDNKTCRYCR